jgi:hypothetical protein
MVVCVDSAEVTPGGLKAREWLKKMAARVKKVTGLDVRVTWAMTPKPGEIARYYWEVTLDSLAGWADYTEKMRADKEMQALAAEGFGASDATRCFAHNTYSRTLYEVL